MDLIISTNPIANVQTKCNLVYKVYHNQLQRNINKKKNSISKSLTCKLKL